MQIPPPLAILARPSHAVRCGGITVTRSEWQRREPEELESQRFSLGKNKC